MRVIRFSPQYFAIQHKYNQKKIKMNNDFNNINNSEIMKNGYELEGKERDKLIKDEHLYYVISDISHVFIMQLVFRTGVSDYIVNAYSIMFYQNKNIPKKELIQNCKDLSNQWNLDLNISQSKINTTENLKYEKLQNL